MLPKVTYVTHKNHSFFGVVYLSHTLHILKLRLLPNMCTMAFGFYMCYTTGLLTCRFPGSSAEVTAGQARSGSMSRGLSSDSFDISGLMHSGSSNVTELNKYKQEYASLQLQVCTNSTWFLVFELGCYSV